jgi:hypothetical protein
MFGDFEGWLLAVILISGVGLFLYIRHGPVAALGATMVLSFAFPVWVKISIGGIPVNIRTTIAIINLTSFLLRPRSFHPQGKILVPLTLLDFSVAITCLNHIISDAFATGFSHVLPCLAYGEWVLPYVAGRYAVRDLNDVKWIAPWALGLLLFLGAMSCIESLTKVNPFELVFGNRPTELAGRNASRLDLKRAFGPTMHPIFFGMMIAVLMPWLACMWEPRASRHVRTFAVVAGVAAFSGAVFTISRTPVFTILGTASLALALRYRVLRWPLFVSLALTIVVFAVFPNEVTDAVSRWTGGGDKPRLIEIDGQAVITSSSRGRLHYFGIYSDALVKAGPFGYGSQATTGFPLRIPGMEGSFKSANLFEMVDNAYILITLRFGWVGCGCLVILFLTSIATGWSLYVKRPDQLFPGAVACMLVVVACFSLFLVFLSYDFGFVILWTMGILSGLASSGLQERSDVGRSHRYSRS